MIQPGFGQIKHYQHFGLVEGLLSNQITDIAEGSDGYIWITTRGAGISRYDGIVFENFNNPDSAGTAYYYCIAAGSNELWFGADNRILRYSGNRFTSFLLPAAGAIRQMTPYSDSLLFGLGDDTAFIFNKNTAAITSASLTGLQIHHTVIHQGELWLATDSGVWKESSGQWTQIYQSGPCHLLLSTSRDGLFCLDAQKGLVRIGTDGTEMIIRVGDLPSRKITFLKAGALGEVYFGTADRGIQIFQILDSLWLGIDQRQLQHDHVTAMVFDRWENAWVTTAGGGLTRFYTQAFNIHSGSRLSGRFIQTMHHRLDTIYIRYDNGRWDRITYQQIKPDPWLNTRDEPIVSHYQLNSGRWLAGATNLNLHLDTMVFGIEFGTMPDQPEILDLLMIDSTRLVAGTSVGLAIVEITTLDSLPSFRVAMIAGPPVTGLVAGNAANIWFYGDQHLGVIDNRIHQIIKSIRPTCLIGFDQHSLLLGTRNEGLFFVSLVNDSIQLSPVTAVELPFKDIRALAFDRSGFLWIASRNQVVQARLTRANPLEVIRIYDQSSGLPRLETLENCLQIDQDNHIFIGTSHGLLELLPDESLRVSQGPVLSLLSFSTAAGSFDPFEKESAHHLKAIRRRDGNIEIAVRAIDQRSPEGLRYWYQLKTGDTQWLPANAPGDFRFYALPPGNYRFRAKAINGLGIESNLIDIPFVILTPLYQRWWFLTASALVVFALGFAWYRWRLQVHLKASRQKADALQTQNKILRLEQAASRLRMNPHFIFNSLQSIQSKISEGDRDKARVDLQSFSRLMRGYLDYSGSEKILLEDEIDLLDQYLRLEQELKAHRFDYEIVVPDGIDPSFIEIPGMLLQPFVENAIKHGIPRDGRPGKIRIEFAWQGKFLLCTITDNGPGIDSSREKKDHRPAGMEITQQRLAAYFKDLRLDPLIVESNGQKSSDVTGTRVRVLLPTEF
jgi:ligand-binding sensor domain-containing protein/two-component sensor histidine kinase